MLSEVKVTLTCYCTHIVNSLTTNDDCSRHRNLAACYQLVQFVLNVGSALAERVGQGKVWVHPEGDSACQL